MKLVINYTSKPIGGGLTYLNGLLSAWDASGVLKSNDVTLLVRPETVKRLSAFAVNVVEVGYHNMGVASKLLWEQVRVPRLIRDLGSDVLFSPIGLPLWDCPIPFVPMFTNAAPFSPYINLQSVGAYTWLYFKTLGVCQRWSAKRAKETIFISKYYRDVFIDRFGLAPEKAHLIYHARDGLRQETAENPVAAGRYRKWVPYILAVSHLYPYKRLETLLIGYAGSAWLRNKVKPRLVIAGEAQEKRYERGLKNLTKTLGIEDWVVFAGAVPFSDIAYLLKTCWLFVLQSTCENCPQALLEAMSLGVPIACSNVSVMPEIAGDAAVYYDPFDPRDCCRAMKILADSADLREELSHRGRRNVLRFPTWSEVGEMTLACLRSAAGRS